LSESLAVTTLPPAERLEVRSEVEFVGECREECPQGGVGHWPPTRSARGPWDRACRSSLRRRQWCGSRARYREMPGRSAGWRQSAASDTLPNPSSWVLRRGFAPRPFADAFLG